MGRLFWKIFAWFWLALVLLNLAVGWGVKLYFEQTSTVDGRALQTQVDAIALAFEHGNPKRARTLLREFRAQNALPLFVVDSADTDVLQRPLPPSVRRFLRSGEASERLYHAQANLPDGHQYRVVALSKPPYRSRLSKAPVALALGITLVVSTLVCYLLAGYLSAPVRRLSTATRQLSEGKLEVRVGNLKRRDEIADLAVDFDRMADKIQQLLYAQKQLLQDISHELRSPLARMQVALALAQRKDTHHQADFDRIGKDLNRLETLIGEVLTLSRLDSVTYPRQEFDLDTLVATIVDDCQMEAGEKACRISSQLTPGLAIDGSPELLRRAIENVLRNAIKFTARESCVDLELRRCGKMARIAVGDRGPGIPEESKGTMFEAFVRIDPARQHKPGGYGLGLAIARKAVELHGGTIVADNREGGGLIVTITLPVVTT